jgi:hypothetical protein
MINANRGVGKLAAVLCLLMCMAAAQAAAPDTLGYQGRLTQSGAPVNGTVSVTFRLYNSASGGSVLWSEGQSVTPANGLYSVVLGQSVAFPAGLFSQPLWLGVTVGTDPEMTPRQALTAVPYSQRAKSAASADTASYASALSVTPTACSAGQYAQGISASGNAVGCAAPSATTSVTMGGDVTGASGSSTVVKLQGRTMASTAPTTGQVLSYNGTQWAPTSPAATQQLPTTCAANQIPAWNGSSWACGSTGNITGNLSLPISSSASVGNITKNGVPFIHDYGYGNTFLGANAGNFTMTSSITGTVTGAYNTAVGGAALYQNTTGAYNTATGLYALTSNSSGGFNTAMGQGALQLNTTGSFNTATGQGALVSNDTGIENTATGQGALQANTTGAHNTAIGKNALVLDADGQRNIAVGAYAGADLISGHDNIYIGNAGMASESNTIRIGTSASHIYTHIAGIVYTDGPINPPSDVNLKTDFEAIDPSAVLKGVLAMPVRTWRYKIEPRELRHIGPTAQDFSAAFGVGVDDKHIATVDADGVALAAIQGMNAKLEESIRAKDAEISQLRFDNELLKSRLADVERSQREELAALKQNLAELKSSLNGGQGVGSLALRKFQ